MQIYFLGSHKNGYINVQNKNESFRYVCIQAIPDISQNIGRIIMCIKSILLCLVTAVATIFAYDVGCIFPEEAPDETFFAKDCPVVEKDALLLDMEAPLTIRLGRISSACQDSCFELYSPGIKDPITQELPVFVAECLFHFKLIFR